jgi:hypothetical protein
LLLDSHSSINAFWGKINVGKKNKKFTQMKLWSQLENNKLLYPLSDKMLFTK